MEVFFLRNGVYVYGVSISGGCEGFREAMSRLCMNDVVMKGGVSVICLWNLWFEELLVVNWYRLMNVLYIA